MITYFAKIPTVLDLIIRENLEIKIDILLEKLDLPTIEFENVQTFAVDVKSMKCFTLGVTIGNKILTLAKGSVGMELESDYPKQIYDLDALISARLPEQHNCINLPDRDWDTFRELKTSRARARASIHT